MNPEMQQIIDVLKDVKNPFTLLFLAAVVGAIVRVLKTKKAGEILDAIPLPFIRKIPKDVLPWVSVGLGMLIVFLDGKINGKLSWEQAAMMALVSGVLSGGTAIGGNETVAKLLRALIGPSTPAGDVKPDAPKPPDSIDTLPRARVRARPLIPMAVGTLLLGLVLQACAMFGSTPKAVTKNVLSIAEIICLETGKGAMITDAKEAAKACEVVDAAQEIAPELVDIITKLIGQREAGKRAGYHWAPPGVVETVAKDAGAPEAGR